MLLNWVIPCRTCCQCLTGHQNICEKKSPVTGANPDDGAAKLLDLYAQGSLKLDELITRTYALENLQKSIDDMMAGRNAKGVVVFPSYV
jgi:Zn-dependent alcohol dehydrogenase